jgi:hypothetical protein
MIMTKKLIIMGILMIPFLLLTRMATAQTYEEVGKDIQAQMDINKGNNVPIWSEINFNYEVSVTGLESEENAILLERAKTIPEIISVDFDVFGNIIVVCKGGTDFVVVKPIFAQIVSGISSIKNNCTLKNADKK